MEILQKDFALLAGVSKAAISKAINKTGKLVKTASGKIDTEDGLAKLYLLKHSMKPPEPEPPLAKSKEETPPLDPNVAARNNEKFDLAAQKLKEEVGDIKAKRELKEIKVQEAKDDLVRKDRLGAVVFGYLDTLNANILDSPDTMIDHIIDKVKSGAKKGEIVKYMRDTLGVEIRSTKKQIAARLK